ncbi:MAG: FAD-dependent protein [Bacteroidia bacterium]
MIQEINIVLSPREADDESILKKKISEDTGFDLEQISGYKILKRSIDARSRNIKIQLKLEAYIQEPLPEKKIFKTDYPDVSGKESVLIAGAGPAGLFAALRLIELGKKPVIIERGKNVKDRRRDLAAIHKQHIVHPDSNYCFGEGGAGTYSDGKLYTRSTKRGDVSRILDIFVAHGANEDILVNAHPHIGTNKLPNIIAAMRETILKAGGEIHFNTRITDFILKNNFFKGIQTLCGKEFLADKIILATGHSARDIFEILHRKNIFLEAKPFAMGVRVEHPQSLIDSIQYHCSEEEVEKTRTHLPAAPYSLVAQAGGKGVYSFCMCPGGIIAPCATAPEQVVTNGWSPSKRNNPFANSGLVVSIDVSDLKKYSEHGALAGMYYQQELEKMAFEAGGKTQTAPAQRLMDFIQKKNSATLPICSYQPGIKSASLHELLPHSISSALQEGLKIFGQKMPRYLTNEAVIVGVETRTSSPVKIPRDKETLEHPQIKGFYPCGEGAGYAGGIISAAIDGEKCAEAISRK